MPIDLKIWKERVREAVTGIADKDLQQRSWFGKGPEIFSPEEMFCQFFDDARIEKFLERTDINLSIKQKSTGKHLVDLMRQLSDKTPEKNIDPITLMDDPLMVESRLAAKQFLAIL